MSANDSNTPYSPFKVAHHAARLEVLRDGGQIAPSFIQMMISDLCNENCSFCAYRMENYSSNAWFGETDPSTEIVNNNPNRMIPYEKCIETIDNCVEMGIKAIEFTGGGEPTVHPKHKEIFQYALDKGLELGLVTNGVLMRKGLPEILAKFKWVRVSVDSASEKTYSEMRDVPPSYFPKVIKNICAVVDARDRSEESETVIGVGFVVTRENYHEIKKGVGIFSKLGVDNIRLSAVFQPDDASYFQGMYEEARDLAQEASDKYQTEKFRVFNLFGDRIEDLKSQHPEYSFCGFQQFQCIVGGDQNVYRCCNTAYNPMGFIGSIKDQSFKELWEGEVKKEKIENFDARGCPRCMFNSKNRFINYLIADDPKHVNFV